MRDRSDFKEVLTKLHRLHQGYGEEQLAPIPYWQYQKWHPSSSSSSTSWWQWNDSWWSSWQLTRESAESHGCLHDHHFIEEELKSLGELSNVCSWIVLKCLYLARTGGLDILVREQTCLCYQKVDQSLWQTLSTFDIIHASYKWIQTILSCGKHSTTMQMGTVWGLWYCQRFRRLEFNIRRNSVLFWKWHVRAKRLDVQETAFCFKQFCRSWNYFSRCRFTHGLGSRSESSGNINWGISFLTKPNQ